MYRYSLAIIRQYPLRQLLSSKKEHKKFCTFSKSFYFICTDIANIVQEKFSPRGSKKRILSLIFSTIRNVNLTVKILHNRIRLCRNQYVYLRSLWKGIITYLFRYVSFWECLLCLAIVKTSLKTCQNHCQNKTIIIKLRGSKQNADNA